MFRRLMIAAAVLAATSPAVTAQETRAAREAEARAAAEAQRGWMGVQFQWRDDRADEAVVAMVFPRSAAETAGLRRGDVVVRIDGRAADEAAVDALRETLKPGGTVVLAVRDGDRTRDVRVTATARPQGEAIARRVLRITDRDGVTRVDTLLAGEGADELVVMGPAREALRMLENDTSRRRVMTYRFHMDSMAVRLDSLRGHMDSLRVHLRSSPGFEIEVDGPMRALELEDEAFREAIIAGPRGEMGPLPFFMEVGRRSLGGAELAEMNDGLGRYFRVDEGLLVLAVSPGTPAARAGLEAGDVIVEVEGSQVADVTEFRRAVARAEDGSVALEVVREGRRRELTMKWDRVRPVRIRTETRAPTRTN
jgi:C-terminal processing protease CtpA/Prc